ncbi:semaphorin-4A isoform X2 [Ornithorhynchus anatinus]|uniref:Semaphorin 4A n=1 Tax=Ornithorhynchus anatinus TaxID=9258 RepID=F6TRJ5_ORNAN|nr:semaphorin-4A isoform X2 [Ornithorhynchus anatinus]
MAAPLHGLPPPPPPLGLSLLLPVLMSAVAALPALVPRVSYATGDGRRAVDFFHLKGLQDFDTLLLSDDGETLYVGARDMLLALQVGGPGPLILQNSVPWSARQEKISECIFKKKSQETECFNFIRVLVPVNSSHLYTCGTGAFSPACTYVDLLNFSLAHMPHGQPLDGKGQSPFDPAHKHTAVMVGGELYSGTMNNFLGNEPILLRSLGTQPPLKTDNFLLWLQPDAAFAASFSNGSFIYFLFSETASEFHFFEPLTVSRVARVCQNDKGGEKLLQKKWTTFLKAPLTCKVPGQLPCAVVRHAVLLPAVAGGAPTRVIATFTYQWQTGGSAVCEFPLEAMEEAFAGRFKEMNQGSSQWTPFTGTEPTPRPGTCSTGPSSDKVLTFVKNHFLMDKEVTGSLLLAKADATYTRLAAELARGLDGHPYLVLYLGTDSGRLHKVVLADSGRGVAPREAYLVEEIQLFPKPTPVRELLLDPHQGVLLVGSAQGLVRIPRANCSVYPTCADCVLARDPHCAWQEERGVCSSSPDLPPGPHSGRSPWHQDVDRGNPRYACGGERGRSLLSQDFVKPDVVLEVLAARHALVELPCPRASALASYQWTQGVPPDPVIPSRIGSSTGDLLLGPEADGLYQCWAEEAGYRHPVATYWVHSPDRPQPPDPSLAGVPVKPWAVVEGGEVAPAGSHSYWPHFLVVTVLLALLVTACLVALLVPRLAALRAQGRVQGDPLAPREKGLLSPGSPHTSQHSDREHSGALEVMSTDVLRERDPKGI